MIIEKDETDSTQDDIRTLAQEGAPEGTAVVAVHQRSGRGRRGREWQSDGVSLTLSVLVRPGCPLPLAPRLPLCAVVAISDVLAGHGLPHALKWPNDILVPSSTSTPTLGLFRKAAGLLLEVLEIRERRAPDTLAACVVGLGLNLAPPAGGFGADLPAAGAFFDDVEEARRWRQRLMAPMVAALTSSSTMVRDPAFASVLAVLRDRSATLGREVSIAGDGGAAVEGAAVDFDADGALIVSTSTGPKVVRAGDVSLLGRA